MLKREIKRWDLVLLMINTVIGAGIFGLPSVIFNHAGVYSILAIMVCGVLVTVITLNFSEVASQFNKTGGPYLYTLEAFGKFPGYIIGWLALVSRIAAYAALVNLLVDYLSYLNEAFNNQLIRNATIVLFTAFIFFVNYKGVRSSSRLNNFLGVAKLVPLLIFIVAGLFMLDSTLLDFDRTSPDITGFSSAILVFVFAFTGFEAAVINTGEMSDPQKDIPFALLVTTLFVGVFYSLIQIVCIGTFPQLADSTKPIADAAHNFLGPAGGLLITVGAVICIGGTLNANMLAGSRLPFAFGEAGQFPAIFAKTHDKTAVPYISLVLYAVVTILVSVTGTFIYALTISVISKVFIFATISAALIKFRRVNKPSKATFVLRYGHFSAILGIIICIWMLFASRMSDFLDVLITVSVGIGVFFIQKANR
ncbi:MAG: amino acid transporter [Bacteroidetes bacterium GWF2_40_14]|nr:MAG: amino acid transporter [Bacteroidetes bacterium GWF2_40_14]